MRPDPWADMCGPAVNALPTLTTRVRDLAVGSALVPVILVIITRVVIRTWLRPWMEDAAAVISSVVVEFTRSVE